MAKLVFLLLLFLESFVALTNAFVSPARNGPPRLRPTVSFSICRHGPPSSATLAASNTSIDCTETTRRNLENEPDQKRAAGRVLLEKGQSTSEQAAPAPFEPPPWLQELRRGNVLYFRRQPSSNTSSSSSSSTSQHAYSLECLSTRPFIYLLRNFLSPEECEDMLTQQQAELKRTQQQAQTLNGQGSTARSHCHVSWIDYDDIATDVAQMCLPPPSSSYWVERLQLLEYDREGKYVLHHDGHDRVLSCLYYLNRIGGTWFPLADVVSEKDEDDDNKKCPSLPVIPAITSRDQALAMSQDCIPGRDGILFVGDEVLLDENNDSVLVSSSSTHNRHIVNIQAGDAVVFYNYRHVDLLKEDENSFGDKNNCNNKSDIFRLARSMTTDWSTLHAGMPTPQTKRIANHWFHVGVDGDNDE